MRHYINIVESVNAISAVWSDVEHFVTEEIGEAESMWNGGIADFGDSRAAHIIQQLPDYDAYAHALRASLHNRIGWPLTVYRCMPRDAILSDGEVHYDGASENWATSLTPAFPKGYVNFAGHKLPQAVVAITLERPEAIIMRGKLSEAEIIIDSGWIGHADAIRVIG